MINGSISLPLPHPLTVQQPLMPPKKIGGSQPLCHSTRQIKTNMPESSDSGRISRSPTPVWSMGMSLGSSGDTGQHGKPEEPQPPEDQPEEDEICPTMQEVAATLVAMRSRHSKSENRGHKVRHTNSVMVGSPSRSIFDSRRLLSR